jgi:hypothetical protein
MSSLPSHTLSSLCPFYYFLSTVVAVRVRSYFAAMLATQRYFQVGFAIFLVLVLFTFFSFRQQDEAVVYEHIAKVPYR